ncbi:MAG: endonuclease/exonuclease/phosphatase family protein [Fimbriimonadaceae bacterium]|nr:endonuclease/exonuclease/phosphatase family protein [Fimbriimonadaceae bacterium]QYK58936.1 MAG: endonuclease/exonuclease/phosphatase family protein [Fimbriimonadaceae bacterium]
MSRVFSALAFLVAFLACQPVGSSPRPNGEVRLMTYNIEWFSEDANPQRVANIKQILNETKPDVVALQEIQSKRALEQIFGPEWQIGILDSADEKQELAIAVRKPFVLVSSEPVFKGPLYDFAFPRERDPLRCVVQTPDGKQLVVYVVHMKSRREGRATTDPMRESAAGLLAAFVRSRPEEPSVAVMGDFNDAPDDRSLNILTTGDLLVEGGPLKSPPRLMTNLGLPLWEKDTVTIGLDSLFDGKPLQPVVRGAREDNARLRGMDYKFPDDVRVRQTMFDQVLVSPALTKGAKAEVYSGVAALRGQRGRVRVDGDIIEYLEKGDRASDHLPVLATIKIP